jgi:phage/plasmid-associated DNA primase
LLMSSNGYFSVSDTSDGNTRRANIIPFTQKFVAGENADVNLVESILERPVELSGILNLCLAGFHRVRERGCFDTPTPCQVAKDKWLSEVNNTLRFVTECLSPAAKGCARVKVADIRKVYNLWAEKEEIPLRFRLSRQKMISSIVDRGFEMSSNTSGNTSTILNGGLTILAHRLLKSANGEDFDLEEEL